MANSTKFEAPLDPSSLQRLFDKAAFDLDIDGTVHYKSTTKLKVVEPKSSVTTSTRALTFGVEFEFTFAHDSCTSYGDDAYDTKAANARKAIADLLNAEGIPAEFQESLQRGSRGNKFLFKTWKAENPTSWYVKTDPSIAHTSLDLNDKFTHYAIEVVTPAFEFSEPALNQVQYVCYLLLRTGKIKIDNTCALHVHIGNGIQGFTFHEVQALLALYWTFEPQIQSPQPDVIINNDYSLSLRTASKLICGVNETFYDGSKGRAGLEWILARTEDDGIDELYGETVSDRGGHLGDRPALNLQNLTPLAKAPPGRTVEFRQHEMTLDPERVGYWISTCRGLVSAAIHADKGDKDGFHAFLRQHIDHTPAQFTLPDLLSRFDLGPQAEFYQKLLGEPVFGTPIRYYKGGRPVRDRVSS
jgi:hypothetical protein